ncbi:MULTISPECIES: ABC transporter ATP-binding protein [unclassified Streptomyces]|uniref:ABC transporter ATP-binding protein n=1 Tax=unclassified Streptomyces TaxID=2593676 RepID=UPI000379D368|nr:MULTISPECIES: ABC transporter ATP-binding protein [unclassified Streptomyces]MYT30900.1 ATP-binding cassette domain-containing protein [Streptomyces sp. SID8354]
MNDGQQDRTGRAPGTWRRIAECAAPFRSRLIGFFFLVLLESALIVLPALLTQRIVDEGVLRHDKSRIIELVVLLIVLATVAVGVTLLERRLAVVIGEGMTLSLRQRSFAHVQHMPVSFFTRVPTGSLVTRLDSDVLSAQRAFTTTASTLLSNLVAVVAVAITLIFMSWQITLLTAVLVPACLLPTRVLNKRVRKLNQRQLTENAALASFMTERFSGQGAVLTKLYGRPETEAKHFECRGRRLRDAGIRLTVNNALLALTVSWLATVGTAAVYLAGGFLAVDGGITVGTLMAMVTLMARLYGPITSLSQARAEVTAAVVSFERIFEVLDLVPDVHDSPTAVALPPEAASITFENVRFRHHVSPGSSLASIDEETPHRGQERDILRGIDLHVEPGSTIAVVGPSGAGKSTLVNLVCRLYDPVSGTVRIGQHDLRSVTQESLRDAIGVVAQDSHFFHDTLRVNLTYALPDASDEACERACREAMVWDTVQRLPEGLDTVVGDGGHHLSGGERQRLAIARLLLKNPRIVVLDEATAHLDSESETKVQQALARALQGRTALLVAHRLSTVRGADRIVVLQDGGVAESGSHEELLAADGLYASLYRAQFGDRVAGTGRTVGVTA